MVSQGVSTTQSPQQVAALQERINHTLLNIVRDNFNTQYASKAPLLAAFRDAVSAHGGTEVDVTKLLGDFRPHVPLSNYDAYKPFVDKFDARPCKEEDVLDLLSPGLPEFIAVSSATSGAAPKLLPKYDHDARLNRPYRPVFDPNGTPPFAGLLCTHNREIKKIERAPGQAVHKIPVCIVTGAMLRKAVGRLVDEESQESLLVPGYAVPWAATVIGHLPSFLIIHALFWLSRRDLKMFAVPFMTLFVDFVCHIDEKWDVLVSCIRDGTLPGLEGIDHVRAQLQARFVADPARARELLDIGPPFSSSEGWFARIWPNASVMVTVCSGSFATVLPKTRFVLGPNVAIRSAGYRASEGTIGIAHSATKLDEFVLQSDEFVEFLDVSGDETHQDLRQAWQVEVGKQYEPIMTTRDGLWRYRLGDIISIIGFDAENGRPVFKHAGRRSVVIHLSHAQISGDELLAVVRALHCDDVLQVQEFTTTIDDREVPSTVGFFVECAGPLGPNAHQARQRLFDAFVTTNIEHALALAHGEMRLPTIRVVAAGTFAAYRCWRGERANIVAGQIKVPLVVVDPEAAAWILERVVMEL